MTRVETSRYFYDLPRELVAKYPQPRGTDRLLVVSRADSSISHRRFSDLPGFLRPTDVLVLNDTRVIPARLEGRKATGGAVEVLLLKELEPCRWLSLVRASKPIKPKTMVFFDGGHWVRVEEGSGGKYVVTLSRPSLVQDVGKVPLPPYMEREPEDIDREAYQTVYASKDGSVAAPTAGLHFTRDMLEEIAVLGVETAYVTLHVGVGTFAPIRTARVEDHVMHEEEYDVSADSAATIARALEEGGRIVAVGTTVTRVLEHLMLEHGRITAASGTTSLFITEGFPFRATSALLTNFHLPCSTLLVLVCAFGGYELVMRAYREAVERRYRFFSYGDAMLIV